MAPLAYNFDESAAMLPGWLAYIIVDGRLPVYEFLMGDAVFIRSLFTSRIVVGACALVAVVNKL